MIVSLVACAGLTNNLPVSTTEYYTIGNGKWTTAGASTGTEADAQSLFQAAGTFSNLYCRVIANDRTTSTFKLRIGGSNVNESVSITGSTTGEFEDTTDTDAITAGTNLVVSATTTGTGGTTLELSSCRILFNATGATVGAFVASEGNGYTAGSTTFFATIASSQNQGVTQARAQVQFRAPGTLQNFSTCIRNTSTFTATCTIGTQVAGSNGNIAVSITAAASGLFSDTSDTDAVSSGTKVNIRITTGAGSGTLRPNFYSTQFACTNPNMTQMIATGLGNAGTTVGTSQTIYLTLGWLQSASTTTESQTQLKIGRPLQLSNLTVMVDTNTLTASSTFRTRVGASNGNQSVSVGSGAAGIFEDSTDTDTITSSSEVNYQLVTGASGTSIIFYSITMKATCVQQSVPASLAVFSATATRSTLAIKNASFPLMSAGAVRQAARICASSLALLSGNTVRKTLKTASASLGTFSGSCAKSFGRNVSASTAAFSGSVARFTSRSIAGSIATMSAGASRRTFKACAASLASFSGTVGRLTSRAVGASLAAFSGILSQAKVKVVAIFASMATFSGSVTKLTSKQENASLALFSATNKKSFLRTMTASCGTFSATTFRATARTVSASCASFASFVSSGGKTLLGTFMASMALFRGSLTALLIHRKSPVIFKGSTTIGTPGEFKPSQTTGTPGQFKDGATNGTPGIFKPED